MTEGLTYEDGLLHGRIDALERMQGEQKGRLDNHAGRIRILERLMWVWAGVLVFATVAPRFDWIIKAATE